MGFIDQQQLLPAILGTTALVVLSTLFIRNKKKTQGPAPAKRHRDDARAKAARGHMTPIVLDQLKELDYKIDGSVLLAPGGVDDDPVAAEQYHMQRERPFYLNCADYPSAIVLVKSFSDVQQTIKLMSGLDSDKYKLCIACGGHSAYCMVDKSIVIDLQHLKDCTLNKEARTVSIQGGAKILDAHACLEGSGLGFATGTNQDTGVSGLTLAGGAGWLGGQAGFACDTVVDVKVVLPSGELVTANDYENADLLRALRGGGGNFGVVVEWTFKLYDVSKAMGGTVVHLCPTLPSVKKMLASYVEKVADIPDQCSSAFALPCGAPVLANVLTMIGDQVPDSGKFKEVPFFKSIVNLDGSWLKLQNDLGTKEYFKEVAPILEPMQQPTYGMPLGAMVYSFDKAMQDALIHFSRVDYPKSNRAGSAIIVQTLSGEMNRNSGARSSIRHRKAKGWVIIDSLWDPQASEEEIQAVIDWAHRLKKRIVELGGEDGPHNFCDTDGRRIKFFTDEQRKFLEGAKTKYDPSNLMRLNKNIVISHTE